MKANPLIAAAFFFITSSYARAFERGPIASAPIQAPATSPRPVDASCPQSGTAQAVDLSTPVNQRFLDQMKAIQVNTVIRYYDQPNETIPGKTLKPAETDLLARNGFDVLVVFQHNNNAISSFTKARGISDANRSLVLAAANGQRKGSGLYFGADGGWHSSSELAAIKTYFMNAAPLARAAGFKVGLYGSGLVCSELKSAGLIDYCWLANATGWPGYNQAIAGDTWALRQKLPSNCGGKNVDFDVLSTSTRDIGKFRP
jgi:hypothetical protein